MASRGYSYTTAFSIFERPLPVVGFSFCDIQEYIVQLNEKHDFHGQNLALKESIVGSKLFKRNFIEDFRFLQPKDDGFTTIIALVKADLNNTNYNVCLTINAENQVVHASCECPGGFPPSRCKHTFAVLIFIQEYCSKELHSAPTEKLQEWHRPVKKEKFSDEETEEAFQENVRYKTPNEKLQEWHRPVKKEKFSDEETEETCQENVRLPVRQCTQNKKCCVCLRKHLEFSFVRFHRFPKDPELSDEWAQFCGLPYITRASPALRYCKYRICSRHFTEHDYRYAGKKFLLPDAVPSIKDNLSTDVKKLKQTTSIDVKKLKETMSMKLSDSTVSSCDDETETPLFQDVSEDFSPVTSNPVERKSTSFALTPKITEIRSLSESRTPNVT